MRIQGIVAALLLATCTPCPAGLLGYYGDGSYDVQADHQTPEGVPYDPSGLPISGVLIDQITDQVRQCIQSEYPCGGKPSATCLHDINYSNPFVVKVASNWVFSCTTFGGSLQQELQIVASYSGSDGKGDTCTPTCPCRYRSYIQCPNQIIVTPSMWLYPDALVRWWTGCPDPWSIPSLSACAQPLTDPLSTGTTALP